MANGRPGPVEVTGKYATRAELQEAIAALYDGGMTPKNISAEVYVKISTVHGILKKIRERKQQERERHQQRLICKAWV